MPRYEIGVMTVSTRPRTNPPPTHSQGDSGNTGPVGHKGSDGIIVSTLFIHYLLSDPPPLPQGSKGGPGLQGSPGLPGPVETGGGLESRVQKVNQAQSERREDRDVMVLM